MTLSKRTKVDYSGFSLSKITQPRFRHILLLLGWVGYLAMYFLTENLISEESCHVMHCALDDKLPFLEGFVVAYVFWFIYLIFALLYYFIYDASRFKDLMIFIIITQVVAMATYIIYPSVQHLRPNLDELGRNNFFIWILRIIYGFDTPTGVCPSLHVAYSCGIASVFLKDREAGRPLRIFMALAAVVISFSTMLVKQHSGVDVFWGLMTGLLAEIIVYGKKWYIPRIKRLVKRDGTN